MMTLTERIKILQVKAAAVSDTPSDDIKKVIWYRLSPHGAGPDPTGQGGKGQCFTTWFFAGADIRHTASLSAHVIKCARFQPSFTLDQLKDMTVVFIKQAGEFVEYCGFDEFGWFVREVLEGVKQVETKEDLAELMDTLWVYASKVGAWIYHSMPWAIGYMFPNRSKEYFENGFKLASTPWSPR